MFNIKKLFWLAIAFVFGKDIGPPTKPGPTTPLPPATLTRNPDHDLFKRLNEESNSQPYVRRVRKDVLQGTRLSDEIIRLMFNLQISDSSKFSQHSLTDALNSSALSTSLRVFYIYVDQGARFHTADKIQDDFYQRLAQLSRGSTNLLDFLDERYQTELQNRAARDKFSPEKENHRRILPNLFSCQFSVCRKSFPPGVTDYVFIVGRMPLHDVQEIERYRIKQQNQHASSGNNGEAPNVYLAVTVKAAGHHGEKPIRFNAHRFGQRSDNSPQREFSLYIGNWRTDWEFSIGSAEHDEIQHFSMLGQSESLKLHNLQRAINTWEYRPTNPKLPSWVTFHNSDKTREKGEGIRLCCVKPPVLNHPLLNVISRRQFRQEISFIGRMLPRSGGQLHRLREMTDENFRTAVRELKVVSAIEVRDFLWVIMTDDQKVYRLYLSDQRRWELAELQAGAPFTVGGNEYRWHVGSGSLYPEPFFGALSIYPTTAEALSFKKQLNVDKDAEGFLVSFDEHFPRVLNPDDLLGDKGVVSIKCVEVSDEGRGKYAFLPVQQPKPTNPFFAFQPVYAREKGWPAGKVWLVYDPEAGGDLAPDGQTGEARYLSQRILAEEHTYHLIAGSSLFQLKVSGTPYIGMAPSAVSQPPSQLGTSLPVQEASPGASEFTPLSIQISLLNTPWAGYNVNEADRSNFAAHFSLTDETKPPYFLKAYFPESPESAKRESTFYDRYRDRASELFLSSPAILWPDDEPKEVPWALVFPLLDTYDKYLSSAGQASIAQATAVGLAMATLSEAMSDDNLVNFDIDVSQFCFDANGRLVIVDFDNVYEILDDPDDEDRLAPLFGILREGRLPAKNSILPPEARAFSATFKPDDRRKALTEIGPAFSTYMVAVIVLQILKADNRSANGDVPFIAGTLLSRTGAEKVSLRDTQRLEDLLFEMLRPASADRPDPSEVLRRLNDLVTAFTTNNETARKDCARLLGTAI